MGRPQPRVASSVSNPTPNKGVVSSQFAVSGVSPIFKPLDGGPEIPEPLPTPKPKPSSTPKPKPTPSPTPKPTRIYGPPNGGHPVNQAKQNIGWAANTNYVLGKQGTVGGTGSYGSGYVGGVAVTPGNTGRASGALTNGGWTYGAGGTGYAGGATASSFQGISSDRGRR